MDRKQTWAILTAVCLSVVGCRAPTDNNRPCALKKKGADGGAVPITESELKAKTGFSKDFISFGVVECEDLTCVRDSTFASDAGPNDPAMGYCSRPCTPSKDPCLSYDEALDKSASTKLSCRALMLDETTLSVVCPSNPQPGQTTYCDGVNNVKSPYFCGRLAAGGSADAGK